MLVRYRDNFFVYYYTCINFDQIFSYHHFISPSNIGEQLEKVDKLYRQHLLNYNQPKNSDRIPLVLTYSDALPNIHSILWKHMNTLHRSDELKEIFPTPPSVAYSRDKNLHEIIIHKKNTIICFTRNRIYVNIAVKTVCFVNISSEAIHFLEQMAKSTK